MGFYFLLITTGTAVYGDQPALLDVKLLRLVHHPLVVSVTTQGVTLVLFLQGRLAKRDNLSHD